MEQNDLKALANKVLKRNKTQNTDGTRAEQNAERNRRAWNTNPQSAPSVEPGAAAGSGLNGMAIYRMKIDGKYLVALDPLKLPEEEFQAAQRHRFGSNRVEEIERIDINSKFNNKETRK